MSLKIRFLLKLYTMVLASSLAFASEKGELCRSSFNTPKNSKVQTDLDLRQQIVSVLENTEVRTDLDTEIKQQVLSILETTELRTSSSVEEQVISTTDTYSPDKGNLRSSQNLYPLVNQAKDTGQLNAKKQKIEKTDISWAERTFPPRYDVPRHPMGGKGLRRITIQQNPIIKKDVQERMWNLALNTSKNKSNREIIKQLSDFIKNGADIYDKDKRGWTPLDYAVFSGNADLVSILIDQSKRSTRGGYRSFIDKVVGFGVIPIASGYSVSDYKRALRIARGEDKTEEFFDYILHNGKVVTLYRSKDNEEKIIEYLKKGLSRQWETRKIGVALLAMGGLLGLIAYMPFIDF